MRYLTSTLILLLLYTGSLCAKEFKQGEDYFSLGNEVSKIQQITEYFSFYCPACFRQEPFMKSVQSSLADPNKFTKNHVTEMPGRDPKVETLLSQALITAKLLKVEAPITEAIFNYIHVSKANFDTTKDIKNLFLLQGINADNFDKTFASFKVKMEAKRMAVNTQKLREKGYSSVPTLVINNNFIPNTKSIKSYEQYQQLVQHLLTLTQ